MVENNKMSFFKELSKYAKQICASCLLFFAFFLFACRMIIVGASLLDMEIRIGQDFATTSRLVTSHSAGYFVGAIIVSLQDRHLNDFLSMGIGTSVAGAAILVIPFLYNFYAMVFASFLNGLGNSVFDLKVHIALTNLWGPEKVGNSIQILHMFYGLGALLCPAFVRFFLLPIPDEMMDDYEAYKNLYKPDDVQLTCPFFVFGAPSFLLGFCFLYYYFKNPYSAENQEHGHGGSGHKSIEAGGTDNISTGCSIHSKWRIYLAIFWVAAMAHLVFAVAGMTCSYIQAFGVKSALRMDKKDAALVATVFWTSFTLARALFVALTMFVSEQLVVNVCLLMMVGSVVILFGFIATSPICIWLTAVLLGAGHSPIFPFAYSLIAKYFHLTGQHTSLIFLSGVIGDSFHTALSGTLIDQDPMIFAYHIGSIVAGFTLLSFTLPYICQKIFGELPKFSPDLVAKRRSRIGSIMMPPMTRSNSST